MKRDIPDTIRVLYVMPLLSVGGASRIMSEIIPKINASKEFVVDFLIGKCENETFLSKFEAGGIKVLSLNTKNIYNPINIIKIRKIIKHYDLIHVNLFPTIYWVALANVFGKVPLVYTEHSTSNKRRNKSYLRIWEKWVYKQYDRIISISDGTQKNLMEWLQADKDDKRFVVINNGVDLESFRHSNRERIYPQTLIMVSRFATSKDQDTVIRAMTLLNNDVHLLLIGDGDRVDICKNLAEKLKVANRVHFLGTQSDIPAWIGKSDIGIQSSHWEGFGLTAVEMMAGGIPVVASDVEGVKQVVEGAGVLFPPGNYKILAEKVVELLSDKQYYDNVRNECIIRSEMYDINNMVKSYIKEYKDILQ